MDEDCLMATWTTAYVNDLPDSAFACKDADGRHYPHHDASGQLDLPHLRAALSRLGDSGNVQCGKAHLEAHAKTAGVGESKAQQPMKATLLDDNAFRLLALPYGGPIPYPGAPRGADIDRQWLMESTDYGKPPKQVNVDWHHGKDPWSYRAGLDPAEVVGKASDLEFDDDGGWVTVWLDAGRKRTRLIKQLAEAAKNDDEVDIYGSSTAARGSGIVRTRFGERPWRPKLPGEISRWHYDGLTLSTSPQNTKSVLVPIKATLDDLAAGTIDPSAAFFSDLATFIDDLGSDPAPTLRGDGEAKAGRVIAGRNEARLREAIGLLDAGYDESFQIETKRRKQAVEAIRDVLDELDRYLKPIAL